MLLFRIIKFKLFFFKFTAAASLNFYSGDSGQVISVDKKYSIYNLCLNLIF